MAVSRKPAMLLAGLLALGLAGPARAQNIPINTGAAGAPDLDAPTMAEETGTPRSAPRRVTPMLAPIPFKNTQLGWGLMLMGGLIHRFDADTSIKPSTGVIGGFYSENGSWGVMALEVARFGRDAWRLRGGVSHMEINYDFFGIGQDAGEAGRSVPLQQTVNFAVGSLLRRLRPNFYLGVSGIWIRTDVELRDSVALPPPPPGVPPSGRDRSAELVAPGIQAELDTRDDDYWPTRGVIGNLKSSFFLEDLGSSRDFQRYAAFVSLFTTIRPERLVLAGNVTMCAAGGDAPFYGLCTLGVGRGGLRGYQQGRYRDSVMTTVQGELRYHTAGRLGATAFAGFGQVAPGLGDIWDAKVLPAGGVGLRFQLTDKYPMHMRLDYAWGRDGGLLYFAVAEAF